MMISIIAACDANNLIGIDGKLPWHIPEDMKRFKELTMGSAVIMGRSTFDSIGRKPLPGRLNVVISSNASFGRNRDGAIFVDSHKEALKACSLSGYENIFVIGGERIYREAMDYAGRIYLTIVDKIMPPTGNVTRYFPMINNTSWARVSCERSALNDCEFVEYKRVG